MKKSRLRGVDEDAQKRLACETSEIRLKVCETRIQFENHSKTLMFNIQI